MCHRPVAEEVGQWPAKVETEAGDSECGEAGEAKWRPSSDWIKEWKSRLPLQTIMRMLQVLTTDQSHLVTCDNVSRSWCRKWRRCVLTRASRMRQRY